MVYFYSFLSPMNINIFKCYINTTIVKHHPIVELILVIQIKIIIDLLKYY